MDKKHKNRKKDALKKVKSRKLKANYAEPGEAEKVEASAPKPKLSLSDLLGMQTQQDIAQLSENLRDLALASSKITESLAQKTHGEKIELDPLGMAPYAQEVMGKLVNDPEKFMSQTQDFFSGHAKIWEEAAQKFFGNEAPSEATRDKRFADKEWSENAFFDLMKKSYLHNAAWINNLVENVEGVDDLAKRKTSFMTSQIVNAFSPSNFLLTNPVALREMIATKGESLNRGMSNLARDLERGNGKLAITQTDESAFEVGKNVAITPGKVVHRGTLFELIQYTPTTEQVHEIPLLFFPPWINKFYILDLRDDNSMIKWAVSQGFSVFVVSWINPSLELSNFGFEDYMDKGIYEAIEVTLEICGVDKINCVGYCIGGTLLASTMAYMAKTGDSRVNSATFFASQQDFIEAGDLKIFTDDAAFQFIQNEIEEAGGLLDASVMANTFNSLRSNDLIWSFVINNYLLGHDPKPFDLLFWNSDQTRMPKNLHLFYLDNYYRKNNFAENRLEIKGELLSLNDVKTPIYMQSSREDHIAPYRSIFRGAKLFGGDVRMILAGSGHIAGVINHPDANKYQHWLPEVGAPLPETAEEWQASLSEHKGSWWPDWAIWLKARSGEMVAAREAGSAKHPPICDAPGTYVLVK
ncbi:MAG: polyhydroxyalkanoate synthase [Hyphomonadaceae bacterium]|nr:MAG: polyhydroxyalkanoate synthase [Hyphomonadaceae bacterium]KAF0186189.1 MAG: polyhydroxyalkanoate synthase [Hyphomonadaceae bacterium]